MIKDSVNQFDVLPSLTINDRHISWTEVLGSMLLFGKFQPFLREFIGQYVLIQEINQRKDLEVESAELMQAILDFRIQQKLNDQAQFEDWLKRENLDNRTFQQRILLELKVKKLREKITSEKLQPYFEENQSSLAEVHLSCLIVSEQALAEQVYNKTRETSFSDLATSYTQKDGSQLVQYLKRKIQRRSLTPELRTWIESASVGEQLGPIEAGESWGIFRLESITPAELDDRLQRQLEAQLFGQWLVDQVRDLDISFQVNSEPLQSDSQ